MAESLVLPEEVEAAREKTTTRTKAKALAETGTVVDSQHDG
jgi:hypothetical protein